LASGHAGRLAVFDMVTTGVDRKTDRIVIAASIAVVLVGVVLQVAVGGRAGIILIVGGVVGVVLGGRRLLR
jgi:hypothetical protein